jgi:hypothetical protein
VEGALEQLVPLALAFQVLQLGQKLSLEDQLLLLFYRNVPGMAVLEVELRFFIVLSRVEAFEKLALLHLVVFVHQFAHVVVYHDVAGALQVHCVYAFVVVYFIAGFHVHAVVLER